MRTKISEFLNARIRSSGTIGPMFLLAVARLEGHDAAPLARWGRQIH